MTSRHVQGDAGDVPEEFVQLRDTLIDEGFELERAERWLAFGEEVLEFRRANVAIRVGHDRDGPYLTIGAQIEDSSYDASIWEAYLDGGAAADTPSFAESERFVVERFHEIDRAINEDSQVLASLENIGFRRARRALGLDNHRDP